MLRCKNKTVNGGQAQWISAPETSGLILSSATALQATRTGSAQTYTRCRTHRCCEIYQRLDEFSGDAATLNRLAWNWRMSLLD